MELEELCCGICNQLKRTEKDGEVSLPVGIYSYSREALLPFFLAFKLLLPRISILYKRLRALASSFHLLSLT